MLADYAALLKKPAAFRYGEVQKLCQKHHVAASTFRTWWSRRHQAPSCPGRPPRMSPAERLALIEFVDAAAGEGRFFGELKAAVSSITNGRIAFKNPKDRKWLSAYKFDQSNTCSHTVDSYLNNLGVSYVKRKKRQIATIIQPEKASSFLCECTLTQNHQVFSINRYFNNVHHMYHTEAGIPIYNMDEACVTNDDVNDGVWVLDGIDTDELPGLMYSVECI